MVALYPVDIQITSCTILLIGGYMNITVLSLVIGVICAGVSFVLFYSYRRNAGISLAVIAVLLISLGAFTGISQIRENSKTLSEDQNTTNITTTQTGEPTDIESLTGPFAKIDLKRPGKEVLTQYAQAILVFASTSPTPTISGTISAGDLEWAIKNSPRRISEEFTIVISGLPTKIAPRVTLSIISKVEKSAILGTICLYKTGAATEGPCVFSAQYEDEIVSQLDDSLDNTSNSESIPNKESSSPNSSGTTKNTESK